MDRPRRASRTRGLRAAGHTAFTKNTACKSSISGFFTVKYFLKSPSAVVRIILPVAAAIARPHGTRAIGSRRQLFSPEVRASVLEEEEVHVLLALAHFPELLFLYLKYLFPVDHSYLTPFRERHHDRKHAHRGGNANRPNRDGEIFPSLVP